VKYCHHFILHRNPSHRPAPLLDLRRHAFYPVDTRQKPLLGERCGSGVNLPLPVGSAAAQRRDIGPFF
jgi:hypothetical protein